MSRTGCHNTQQISMNCGSYPNSNNVHLHCPTGNGQSIRGALFCTPSRASEPSKPVHRGPRHSCPHGLYTLFGLAIELRLVQQASVNSNVFDTLRHCKNTVLTLPQSATVQNSRTTATLVARTRRYSTRVLLQPCEKHPYCKSADAFAPCFAPAEEA